MAKWLAKAAVQGVMSALPAGHRWNELFQRYVTHSLTLSDEKFSRKLEQAARHVRTIEQLRGGAQNLTVLELGTGWFPIVPVALSLAGFRRVISVDLKPLLRPPRVADTLAAFRRALESGRLEQQLKVDPARAEQLTAEGDDAMKMLGRMGVEYRVGDVGTMHLPAGSVDAFVSNDTFEHVPEAALLAILKEFRRLSAPDAVMSHYVNMRDHYAQIDPSIPLLNFLRYSDRRWRVFNNALQYQNRLRPSDYERLHEAAGFRVQSSHYETGERSVLPPEGLAERFQTYGDPDVRGLSGWIIATPAAAL